MVYLRGCGRGHCAQAGEGRVYGESGHPARLPPLPCAARGLAAPVLHVGGAGVRRHPAPFWGPLFPFIFTQFAEALHWIAVHVRGFLHYLDNYFLARASQAAYARDLEAFQDLCRDLGVPLAPEKLVLPTRCLQFLGITLDSSLQEMCLPPEKLARLRACLPAWRTRQKCTKRELLSLIGVLSFACKVARPGRIFLRRLIDLSMTVSALAHHISLTAAARADIAWWVEFLPSWNGRAFFPPPPAAARRRGGTRVCY